MTEKELLHKRERKAQRRRERGYEIVKTRRGLKKRKIVPTQEEIDIKTETEWKIIENGKTALNALLERANRE